MSYHIYTTDGFILKRKTFGEANTLLYVLTRDLGLIIASAQGSRLSASKLKGSLQEYSEILISCVKGKNGWKITNVKGISNFFFDKPEHTKETLAKISSILLKMIVGESEHPEIYDITISGFNFLKTLDKDFIENLETLMVLRILSELGYVEKSSELKVFLDSNDYWSEDLLKKVGNEKKVLIGIINKALKESHL